MGKSYRTVSIILSFIILCACKDNSAKRKGLPDGVPIEKIPDIILFDFTYRFMNKDKPVWILYSKKAEVFRNEDLIKVDGVHLVFYKNGKQDTVLDSSFGEVREQKKLLTAISNVILKTSDGSTLYTEILHWDDNVSKLYTDAPVKIVRPNGDIVEGIGMEAYHNLEKLVIKRRVKGLIYEK